MSSPSKIAWLALLIEKKSLSPTNNPSLDPYSNLFSPPTKPSKDQVDKKLDVLLKEDADDEFESHWQWLHFYLYRRFSRIGKRLLVCSIVRWTWRFLVPFIQPKPRGPFPLMSLFWLIFLVIDIRHITSGNDLSPIIDDLPGDEENDITLIRDHWAHEQLLKRKSEYSEERHLTYISSCFFTSHYYLTVDSVYE